MAQNKKKPKKVQKPGPKPDVLRLEGDWKSAVRKGLKFFFSLKGRACEVEERP